MNALRYLASRLKEPSTMAGLSAIGVLVGIPPGVLDLAAQVFIGAVGIAAVVLPEKSGA